MAKLRDFCVENAISRICMTHIFSTFSKFIPGEGRIPRHNTAVSRKLRGVRKHGIRKIGGYCCDRSFHL